MDDLYEEALRETDFEIETEVEIEVSPRRPRTPIGPIPKDQPDAVDYEEVEELEVEEKVEEVEEEEEEMEEVEDKPLWKTRKDSRSPSPKRRRQIVDRRSRTRSSSRGTYDGFEFQIPEEEAPYFCKPCRRGFYTIRELSEHEIRLHNVEIACVECEKKSKSVAKLAAHILYRHANKPVICYYCDEKYGEVAENLSKSKWESFREHVYKEIVKKQMYTHSAKNGGNSGNLGNSEAMRGVGKCPHGPPVKCKNFPSCPGAKCIYAHGTCRYDSTCNKTSCPFDHSHRPRTCMTCINDMKDERRRRS